jgi:hypothetical protein
VTGGEPSRALNWSIYEFFVELDLFVEKCEEHERLEKLKKLKGNA